MADELYYLKKTLEGKTHFLVRFEDNDTKGFLTQYNMSLLGTAFEPFMRPEAAREYLRKEGINDFINHTLVLMEETDDLPKYSNVPWPSESGDNG